MNQPADNTPLPTRSRSAWWRRAQPWQTPVVSLALAVAVWIYTSGQVRTERIIAVRIAPTDVTGLPDGYVATAISPDEFRVELSLPTTSLDAVGADLAPRLEIRPGATLDAGSVTFPITGRVLGLPPEVRILATEPEHLATVQVEIERMAAATVPVMVPDVVGLPPGTRAVVQVDPTLVRVEAGRRILDRLAVERAQARFEPVDLATVTGGAAGRERVRLMPSPAAWTIRDPVTATITLVPADADRRLAAVPVRVLGDTGRSDPVRLEPAAVELVLHGPEALLSQLDPTTELTAYVDVRAAAEPGLPYDLPLQISGPAWLRTDPVTIRVTVGAAAPQREPAP
jgi:hypothetical protein